MVPKHLVLLFFRSARSDCIAGTVMHERPQARPDDRDERLSEVAAILAAG
jgi:hypothetical protein